MSKLTIKVSLSIAILMLGLWACGGNTQTEVQNTQKDKTEASKEVGSEPTAEGIEFTAKYQCPMHCPGSGSENYGSCPVCGMHYMYNPNLPGAAEINRKLFKENPQVDSEESKPADGHEGHSH